jgi:uncharacterized protein YrrD
MGYLNIVFLFPFRYIYVLKGWSIMEYSNKDTNPGFASRPNNLPDLPTVQSFRGKPIISISDGQQIGSVEDVLIDPNSMSIVALLTSKGNLFRQDVRGISAREVRVWGKDAILVTQPDVLQRKNDLPELEHALSTSENLRSRDVISLDGERNGEVKDFIVTHDGQIAGIEVSRASAGLAQMLPDRDRHSNIRLPVSTIHSVGKDAVIIDMNKVQPHLESVSTSDRFDEDRPEDEVEETLK